MQIGIVQYCPVWENPGASKKRIENILSDQVKSGERIDWLIFPEMTLSGFTMNVSRSTVGEEDLQFFRDIARGASAHVTFGAVVEGYNKSITMDPSGRIISSYAKVHLFSSSNEPRFYLPGAPPEQFTVDSWRVTPAICFDLRFAYLFWNMAQTTDAYVVIANWPSKRLHHWRTLLQARAIENQCYVIGVNRVGDEPEASYSGGSLVVDAFGTVIRDCGETEGVFVVPLDRMGIEDVRSRFRFLADRRHSF